MQLRQSQPENENHCALSLENISFRYGKKYALESLTSTINAGETVILLGPNGAGKTTLFSLICGLFAPDTGSIRINGKSLLNRADALAPLGIVFQSQTLDLDLSVAQNLKYFCSLHGIPAAVGRERIAEGLDRMDMSERADDKVRTLNGGHRRRVEIIRATLHRPSILLLDEPTVGLDIPTRAELVKFIRGLPETTGCAILWATHLVDELEDTDRVMMLHRGKLRHDAKTQLLLQQTASADLSTLMQQLIDDSSTKQNVA
ncbi:MAG: ATP-binding cassette domain-containing protein [Granulosicoccus sp.]